MPLSQVTFAFILFIAVAKSDIFHFNSSLSCTETDNCQFYQPEIWYKSVGNHNDSVPNDGDSVYLIGSNVSGFTIIIPEESHVLLELLYVSGNFTLLVINKTEIYGNESNVEPIALLVDENSILRIVYVGLTNTGTTQVQAGSVLIIDSGIASLILSSPGTGSLNITDSHVELSNPHLSNINETVTLNGNSSIIVNGIQFTNNNLVIGSGFTTFIIKWMELQGDFFIHGQVTTLDGHFVTRGNISISSGIFVFGSTFLATGELTSESQIVLDVGTAFGANFILQSPLTLVTPTVLSRNGTIATQGPITIKGSVINGGIFYVNKFLDSGANQNVAISGNYTQEETGTHVAFLAKNVDASVGADIVMLSGILSYVAQDKVPQDFNFVVLKSALEISGKFTENVHSYSKDRPDLGGLKMAYSPFSVEVVLTKPTHKLRNGIIIGFVCVGFVALVIGIILIRRLRKEKTGNYKLLLPVQ